MPINITDAERQEEANRDLAAKLKLEKPFKPKVRKLINRMGNDLESNIIATGAPQNLDRYKAQTEGLISEQYENTKNVFSGRLIKQLEEEPEDSNIWKVLLAIGAVFRLGSKKDVLAKLRADSVVRSNIFIDRSVTQDTSQILATSARNLQAAADTARVKLALELERQPTAIELAVAAKKQFLQRDLGRAETIAATTTQRAAEGIKNVDTTVYQDYRNSLTALSLGLSEAKFEEFWITRGDSIVRLFHQQADGQKKVGGVFIVGGESLRYPGDDSLGASLSNTINCRCSNVRSIDEEPNYNLEP